MNKLLGIYLNDHLAGATAGLELARRARKTHDGTELGTFLVELEQEIAEDRATLEQVMAERGIPRQRVKVGIGWLAERAGRAKLNGRWLSRSPLSDLVELEGLHVGITGKGDLWRSLQSAFGPKIGSIDLARLIERAERQTREVDARRLELARRALAAG